MLDAVEISVRKGFSPFDRCEWLGLAVVSSS